jgi:hypothetical protein
MLEINREETEMDIIILATVILTGIALEGLIVARARERAEYENAITDRLARYAGRSLK